MALTWGQVSAITERHFMPKLYDNIFNFHPLLQRLFKNSYVKVDGGTSLMIPLEYGEAADSGWYNASETFQNVDSEVITGAEYPWKQARASVFITRKDELMNSGDAAKVKLVGAKIKNAEKTLRKILATMLYNTGSDPKAPAGLPQIIATGNTVGGISQTDNSWWRGQVDSVTTTLGLAAMNTIWTDSSDDKSHPSVVMATRANFNRFYGLLQPQQRFQDNETAKGGFTSLMFNGAPLISDSLAPANHLLFLTEENLHLVVFRKEDMRFTGLKEGEDQNAQKGRIYWMGGFGSSNNRLHGKMSAVAA